MSLLCRFTSVCSKCSPLNQRMKSESNAKSTFHRSHELGKTEPMLGEPHIVMLLFVKICNDATLEALTMLDTPRSATPSTPASWVNHT